MHPMVRRIYDQLEENADPQKAIEMQAYMKIAQPFYGVQAPKRKQIASAVKKEYPLSDGASFEQVVTTLWEGEKRECCYMALEVAARYKHLRTAERFPLFIRLTETSDHWDTLDWLAADFIGERVLKDRANESLLRKWSQSERLWLRRASLLAHLKHKEATNQTLLAETIEALMYEREFFIRKAIGWVLRQYSRTNLPWVRNFVKNHGLSKLSVREASKYF